VSIQTDGSIDGFGKHLPPRVMEALVSSDEDEDEDPHLPFFRQFRVMEALCQL
jgi:hypothetical protein